MSDRFFLDTNIFVYSFDSAESAKSLRANELIRDALASGKGVVSYQVVQEFLNVALRRFARPMTPLQAEQYLSITLIPLLAVHSSRSLYLQALRFCRDHSVSWYDSLILAGALEARCKILFSEDFQRGQRFGDLRVENPFFGL
jgi:predicted nucleic acid-binding protein